MYYSNKFGFYIKEYGTQIVVGIICFVIVLSGLFLYFKINNNNNSTIITGTTENNVDINDDSILSDELKAVKAGEKVTVKVATVENEGYLIILSGDKRIKAKLIGIDFSNAMPDALYLMGKDLDGKYVNIAFDESKVLNGYAMIYLYAEQDSLYNAKIIEEGRLILDSTINKKSLEYNNLAESQAYAKQTLAGVWGK